MFHAAALRLDAAAGVIARDRRRLAVCGASAALLVALDRLSRDADALAAQVAQEAEQ